MVLDAREHRVVMRVDVRLIDVHGVDVGILRGKQGVVQRARKLASLGALVAQGHHPVWSEFILPFHREVHHVGRRQVLDRSLDIRLGEKLSAVRQAGGRVKGQESSGIGGIPVEAVYSAGAKCVHDLACGYRVVRGLKGGRDKIRWVTHGVQQQAFRNPIVGDAKTAAEYKLVPEIVAHERARTPGEADLWAEVVAVGIREILADLDFCPGQNIGRRP